MTTINLHELIAENCKLEKGPEGIRVWCSFDKGYAVTPQMFQAPIVIEAEAMTDSSNIRLLYDSGQLIFNWEGNEDELRWRDPGTGQGTGVAGAGQVPRNEWVTIVWTIETDYADVSVDGIERYRVEGDFSGVAGQIGIGSAMGSTVSVRKLTVLGTPTDAGTPIPEVIAINDRLDKSIKIIADWADLSGSSFKTVKGEPLYFHDVTLAGTKFKDANLSGLEIDGANLGGAFIHNIGLKFVPDHPEYDPNARMAPVRFERCDFNSSVMAECDLSGMEIRDCDIAGLTINGYSIEQLIREHEANKQPQR